MGTGATISSGVFEHELKLINGSLEVTSVACPLLVPVVEYGFADEVFTPETYVPASSSRGFSSDSGYRREYNPKTENRQGNASTGQSAYSNKFGDPVVIRINPQKIRAARSLAGFFDGPQKITLVNKNDPDDVLFTGSVAADERVLKEFDAYK